MASAEVEHEIRELTASDDDLKKLWVLWQTIFPDWPIEQQRLETIFRHLSGQNFIHEKGFCLSNLDDGGHGRIAAVGVLPEHRGKGLGTALINKAQAGLKTAASSLEGGQLKSVEIGSSVPRFWPQLLVSFPPEVKQFFLDRGFRKSEELAARDFFKDIRQVIAPPEVMDKVSKSKFRFAPWTAEMAEECITKQRATFSWYQAYEFLAAYDQHHEVMVAFDPDTNEQIGWTLMCSPSAIVGRAYAFLPLLPSKEKTGLIAAVGVDESVRGKGVGLALVVKAMENMRERGVEGVLIDAVVIRGFYERMGFETFWDYESYVAEDSK